MRLTKIQSYNLSILIENYPENAASPLFQELLSLPDEEFQTLDFNTIVQNEQHINYGMSFLWVACQRAFDGHPQLLEKILQLPGDHFQTLNLNAAPLHPKHPNRGETVFLIWISHDAASFLLYENLLKKRSQNENQTISVLKKMLDINETLRSQLLSDAHKLTPHAEPEESQKIIDELLLLVKSKEEFESEKQKLEVERHELEGKVELIKLSGLFLKKILALPPEYFQALDFNSEIKNPHHINQGLTPLWIICKLAYSVEIDRRFRSKPINDSTPNRSVIPV